MKNRRKFSREYKVEAVRLAEQRGFGEAASSLGVGESSLYQWRKVLSEEGDPSALALGAGASQLFYSP